MTDLRRITICALAAALTVPTVAQAADRWSESISLNHQFAALGAPEIAIDDEKAPMILDDGRCDRDALGSALDEKTVGGGLIGLSIGGDVRRTMDPADLACADRAMRLSPDGQGMTWAPPAPGERYRFVPRDTFRGPNGQLCRDFVATHRGGRITTETHGTACRQEDGIWRAAR